MTHLTVAWLASLEKIHSELINVILPLATRHALEAPELVQSAESLEKEIANYFSRLESRPLKTRPHSAPTGAAFGFCYAPPLARDSESTNE